MKTATQLSLLAGASLSTLATFAQAQNTADLFMLDELVINSTIDPTAPIAGYVADASISANKTGTPILETPQSVSVITGAQIEDQGATTIGDTLGYTSGVTAQPFGTDPRFDSPTLRGFNSANSQYLNGLRIMRDFGAPSFEIYSLERVEVLKGPSSVLYGAGNPGGIFNQVQKRAQYGDFGEVGIGVGDPKATEGFVDWNRGLSENFAARLTAVARDTEEDVEELTNERGYVGLATRWQVTPTTELQFLGSYQTDTPITPAGVPYDLLGQIDDGTLRSFYVGDPADDFSDRTNRNLGFELKQELAGGWQLNSNFRYQNFDWEYRGFDLDHEVLDGDTITRGIINQFEDSETYNLDSRVTGTVTTGAVTHDLMFGVDIRRFEDENRTEFADAGTISVSNPVYEGADIQAPWYIGAKDLTVEQIGIYAQDTLKVDNWTVGMALRHDWAEQSGTAYSNYNGTSDAGQEDEATTGRIGVSYLFANGIAPYISYATSFDPEIGVDGDGNALEPTEGKQIEAGVKYQPTNFDGFFTASVYKIEQTNLSRSVEEEVNGDTIAVTRQIGEAESIGFELEGSVSLNDNWNIRGAYTWNETEQKEGANDDNWLANAPKHNASLWANYTFSDGTTLEGLTLGAGVRYIGERYGEDANIYKMDDVTLVDAQLAYDLTDDASFSLNVSNVADEEYVATCTAFSCYYGDGRAYQARLNYKW
ncbi:TonB-dependent siderophore receptor [Paracoccaceae bacterium GXU_MW_L88]